MKMRQGSTMGFKWFFLALALVLMVLTGACQRDYQPTKPARVPGTSAPEQADKEIEDFLTSYFETWSSGDLEAYKTHFNENATVNLLGEGKVVFSHTLDDFIELQAKYILGAAAPPHEYMTSFKVHKDGVAASATVEWTMETGTDTQTGIDRFVLMRDEQGDWKIISLVFYN